MRQQTMRALAQHPVALFFVLAYLLSWFPSILYLFRLSPSPIIGVGPFLAALIVLALTVGKAGVAQLLHRMVRWRVGVRWYAVALLLPAALAAIATLLNLGLGADRPPSDKIGAWPSIFLVFPLLLLVPGIGGAWEEPGWRGYALPVLQKRHSPLLASLIIGVLWAGWHLPLFLTGAIKWPDVIQIVSAAIVLTWVVNSTNGSVLIAMLLHAMTNTISGEYFSRFFSGDDSFQQSLLLGLVWALAAVIVVLVAGPAFRARPAVTPAELEMRPAAGD